MAQIISSLQFNMQTFAFERGVAYDSFSFDADGGTLTAATAPGLLAPFSFNTSLSLWDGAGALSTATESVTYMGTDLAANAWGTPVSGTVTGISGGAGAGRYFIVGVSVTALSVFNATQTTTRDDDMAVVARMLSGNDNVTLSAFADNFSAQDGADLVNAGAGNDTINGNSGSDTLMGEDGNDMLYGGFGYDRMDGGYGNDGLYGGDGGDQLRGRQGNDNLYGDAGHDQLFGGYGNDNLYGGVGRDRLIGEDGRDVMYGGVDTDRDVFVFESLSDTSTSAANRDIVHNFVSGVDDIELTALDANTSVAGNQAFLFGGTTAGANSVWYARSGTSIIVAADVNGDAVADFTIRVTGISQILASDFLL